MEIIQRLFREPEGKGDRRRNCSDKLGAPPDPVLAIASQPSEFPNPILVQASTSFTRKSERKRCALKEDICELARPILAFACQQGENQVRDFNRMQHSNKLKHAIFGL
jgi:hypothetical protein